MKALRVTLRAYTASFRPPGLLGTTLTMSFRVPPPSTVYGLVAAALGYDANPREVWIGYQMQAGGTGEDLEKIIAYGPQGPIVEKKLGGIKTIPIVREFLADVKLDLFLPNYEWLAEAFLRPRYPLLLGRSQDVAYVDGLSEVELEPTWAGDVEGVVLPCGIERPAVGIMYGVPTWLPTYPPRKPLAIKPFIFVDRRQSVISERPLLYRSPGEETVVPVLTYEWLS